MNLTLWVNYPSVHSQGLESKLRVSWSQYILMYVVRCLSKPTVAISTSSLFTDNFSRFGWVYLIRYVKAYWAGRPTLLSPLSSLLSISIYRACMCLINLCPYFVFPIFLSPVLIAHGIRAPLGEEIFFSRVTL